MNSRFVCYSIALTLTLPVAWSQSARTQKPPTSGGDFADNPVAATKVPTGVILVKGAWSSASDSVTPLPEGGSVVNNAFSNRYFGMTYPLPTVWTEKFKGPPPSDTGRYVLAQIRPSDTFKGPARATILITAEDMFFTSSPAANALQVINYQKRGLQADYKLELPPSQTRIAGHPFTFFGYWSPVAQLHWYVLATEIRCHTVEIVVTSRDTKLLQSLVLDMKRMELPNEASPTGGTGGGEFPVCIKDYASDENVITKVDPIFTERATNPVPVRIIIDKTGKVKHIHFLSAFPNQAKTITDALHKWKFKPYMRDRQPVEVETGIMFGSAQHKPAAAADDVATE